MELVGGCKNCFMDCLRQSKTFKAYSRHTFLLFNILQQMLSQSYSTLYDRAKIFKYPALAAEWLQIQVAISPLQTQVQIALGTDYIET